MDYFPPHSSIFQSEQNSAGFDVLPFVLSFVGASGLGLGCTLYFDEFRRRKNEKEKRRKGEKREGTEGRAWGKGKGEGTGREGGEGRRRKKGRTKQGKKICAPGAGNWARFVPAHGDVLSHTTHHDHTTRRQTEKEIERETERRQRKIEKIHFQCGGAWPSELMECSVLFTRQ